MSDQYLGEIRLFAGDYAPDGWCLCDGSLLSISGNEALFALLGTTYGGDGQINFGVPDLRGRVLVHQGQNPQTGTTFPRGQTGGTETVTLNVEQLPEHTHVAHAQSAEGTSDSPANGYWASASLYASSTNATMNSALVQPAFGPAQPHENMMPFLALNYIIAVQGLYPPQP